MQNSSFRILGGTFDGGLPAFSKKAELQTLMQLEQNRGDEEAQGLYMQRLKAWRANSPFGHHHHQHQDQHRDQSSLSLLVRTSGTDTNSLGTKAAGRRSRGRIFGYQPEPVGRPVPVHASELMSESEAPSARPGKVAFFQKISK